MSFLNYSIIIIGLAVALGLQLFLTGLQTKRFYARIKEIRNDGLISVGLEGGMWSGRIYAVLVVDDMKRVVHAERLSGMTIFSNLVPVPELIGLNAKDILDENKTFSLKKRDLKAFRSATKEYFKEDEQSQSTIENNRVKSIKMK
jgi:DNA-binding transcriptional regulator of glucitol operon